MHSMKTSSDLLSNDLIPLPNKLKDIVENILVKTKFKIVTQITFNSF
jgi:hypothetical protein